MISLRLSIISLAMVLLSGCGTQKREADGMYPYDKNLDRAFILQQFEQERFWLIADESKNYDPADTLDTGILSYIQAPVQFYIYYKDHKPVGFISYYKKDYLFGKIQFVYVIPEYRRQGIAEKMIRFVFERMRKQGLFSVELVTRLINTSAYDLYHKKLGFYKSYDDGKYVFLERSLSN